MTKRLKISNPIKWLPILSDEYTKKTFIFKTYMKATIIDNKKISFLVEQLHQLYPLTDSKFKRVRKLLTETNKFEILLTHKELYDGVPDHFSSALSNINEIELPVDKVLTKEQFNIVSKYWPISFHLNKYIESLLDNSFMISDTDNVHKCDKYARLTLNLAKLNKSLSAAIIVDPRNDSIIASGIDLRQSHPLKHSTIVALDRVAKRQLKEIPKPNGSPVENNILDNDHDYLKIFIEEKINKIQEENSSSDLDAIRLNIEKPLNPNDYLCTSFTAYLSHEPCGMCAMALVHARISKVYYVFDKVDGFLNSNCKLHCLSSLNHNYEVFKAKEPYLDLESDLSEYFNKNDKIYACTIYICVL